MNGERERDRDRGDRTSDRDRRPFRSAGGRRDRDPLDFADPLEISVREDIDRALKELKKRVNKEGILKELKLRRFYEKPSERKKRKVKEAEKRRRKQMRRKQRRQRVLEHKLRSI